jgi:hypothetical protein
MPDNDKIQISWTELKSAKVEKHVRQQQAMIRNRRYAQMTSDDLPVAQETESSIWYNPIFLLAFFGLIGSLLAWGSGALLHLAPDRPHLADQAMLSIQDIHKLIRTSPTGYGITPEEADQAVHNILVNAGDNPYLAVQLDSSLSPAQKQERIDQLAHADYWKSLVTHIIAYGLCGLFVSIALSIAEPSVDRNSHAAIINGSVGAGLGLAGGLAASLVVDRIYLAIGGANHGVLRQYLADILSFAVLGSFLAVAPGIVMRNRKRLLIGLAGGAVGGAIGGLLLEPFSSLTGIPELARLLAMLCIGGITGAATGLFERAARTGWLRVTAGLIAGKQFILYRNPTYIGSAPDCQIYLFRDNKVGRRHAAIHLLQGGRIEIEDLPLGAPTYINRQPIARQRLRNGDQILIGTTTFLFQEKTRESGDE